MGFARRDAVLAVRPRTVCGVETGPATAAPYSARLLASFAWPLVAQDVARKHRGRPAYRTAARRARIVVATAAWYARGMISKVLLVSAALAFVACGGKSTPTTADPCSDPCKDKDPVAPTWTLVEVSQGDAACYVVVRGDDGAEVTHPGTFDLCTPENEALMGSPVTLTIEKIDMMAASCDGDPECPDTESVDAVTAINAAP